MNFISFIMGVFVGVILKEFLDIVIVLIYNYVRNK